MAVNFGELKKQLAKDTGLNNSSPSTTNNFKTFTVSDIENIKANARLKSNLEKLSSVETEYINDFEGNYGKWRNESQRKTYQQKTKNYYDELLSFVKDFKDNSEVYKNLLGEDGYNQMLKSTTESVKGGPLKIEYAKKIAELHSKFQSEDEYKQFQLQNKYSNITNFEEYQKYIKKLGNSIEGIPEDDKNYLDTLGYYLEYREVNHALETKKKRLEVMEENRKGERYKRFSDENSQEFRSLPNEIKALEERKKELDKMGGNFTGLNTLVLSEAGEYNFDQKWGGQKAKMEEYLAPPENEAIKAMSGMPTPKKEIEIDPLMSGSGYAKYATEDEKMLYSFLKQQHHGEQIAKKYFDDLVVAKLDKRYNQALAKELEEFAGKSPLTASLATVSSIYTSLLSGVEHWAYRTAGIDGIRSTAATATSALREGVSSKMGAFGSVYNIVMSGVDSAVGSAATAAMPGLGDFLLGSSAAASTYNDALDRGVSHEDAALTATLAGVTESFFEHISISKLFDASDVTKGLTKSGIKQISKKVAADMGINFSEEIATEFTNIVSDMQINGYLSSYAHAVKNYYDQGMTEEEARKKASKDLGEQLVEAGFSGAFMGAGFSTAVSGSSAVKNQSQNRVIGNIVKENLGEFKNLAKNINNDKIAKAAQQLTEKSSPAKIGEVFNDLYESAVDNAVRRMTPILLENGAKQSGSNSAKGFAEQIARSALNGENSPIVSSLLSNKVTKDVYREFTQNGEYGGATLLALKEIATSPNAPIESVTENTVLTSQGEILPVDAYGENVAAGPVRRSDLATYPKQSTVDGEQRTKEPHPITEAYGKRVAERLENERPTPQRPTNKKITKAGEVLVKAIGKSMGIEVEFTDNAVDGVADGKTVDHKKVYISRYTVDPIKEVIKHEFTHTTEISKHYEKIQKYLFDESKAFNAWLESKGYAKWPQMETDIINLYKENGETLDHEGAKTEIVAKFVSENLFEDGGTEVTETFLKELYLKDRNLFDRFVDWVKSVYARLKANDAIKADIIKLEQKFIRLAETAKKQRVKDNQTNDKSGKSQYLFVGKKSKTADKLKLATAKQMLKDGADSETIRKETGWFKGYDGKWRFEISDKDLDFSDKSARFVNAMLNRNKIMSEVLKTPNLSEDFKRKARTIIKEYNATEITEITLGDLIKHDALFEAYPELKNYMVKFKLLHGVGAYHYKEKTISIDPNSCKSLNKFKKIIIHEIQHAVQHYEGFAMGSSNVLWHDKIREGNGPKYKNGRRMTAKAAYMNTAGEIEARDAENRLEYDDAKRESTRPDIDNKNVVFSDEILKKYIASGTQNAQYSIPSDHNYVYTDGKASFTEERLNNLFDEHSLGDGKRAEHSNAYVGYISPEDFVNLTSNENIRSRVEDEAYILNEEELKNEKETPFLEYDPATGEVVNHEGRHRMLALKADGITRVAVLLKPTNDSFERRTPQDISLTGQNFAGGKASGNVTVKTAVPLSEKYREKAIKKFAQNPDADVRYSLPTEGIPSQPLHYVKMYSEAMKDSKIKRLYEEAKNGNDEAAVELADYCFDDKFAKEISNKYNGCYLISINGIDGKSINKIPMVISSTLSKKTNLKNFLGIFKISKNNMRDKTNAERLSEKVLFDTIDDDVYNSIKGKRFVIVDDTVNTGTTTNALARYLEKAGGKVAGTVSLFKGQDHYNNQAITEDLLIKIESRLGRENAEKFIRQYGYADKLEQLTRKQAEHLLKIGIDNSRGTRNAEGGGKTSVEGGGRILSQASGKTKTISTELEADSVDGSVSSLPKKSEEQYSLSDSKYMSAVESGDTKTQEKIVADAAKTAGAILGEDGNPLKLYRGTKGGQTVFSKDVTHNGKIYTTDKVYIASNYGDKSGETTAISEQVEGEPATYALYGFPKKMLTMDAQALPFSDLVIPEELQKYSPDSRKATNAQIAEWAEQAGYDALHIKDVRDGGAFGWNDQYIFFDENLVKSADTVTRDNDGNIIPPSERFNEKKTDIRYSLPDIPDIAVGKSNTELEQLIKDGKITLDDAVNSMNDQYGTMPKGENPKVDVDVPNKVSDTRGVRRFARTALESGHLTDGMTEDAKREILNGVLNYNISSNKMAVTIAENKVKNDINAAVQEWESIVNSGKIPSARDIVLGEVLMVEAAKAGNANDVAMYLAELASMGTQLGQGIQALSLLKKLSGVGQLHYVSRVIAQMNKDLENRYGNKYVNILTLDPDLESILAQSKNPAEIENIIDDILTDVAKQMPSTWADKFNAWRYLAMLGNTRTHIRNFFGNAVFMPAIRLKNTFAAIAEKLTVKNHDNRTKVLKVKKEYKDFAEADFENIKDIITSGGKLSPSDRVQDRRKVFTSKAFAWLEKARKFNFDMLEKEDLIFLKHHYKQALGSVLQARGIDVKNITEQQLASARDYAIEEAQKATYRDFSHFANALNKLAHPTKKGNAAADVLTKAGGLLVEGAVPFKKTPINVLKRGIEYSPLGIATSLGNAAMSAARGEFSGTQLINDLSAGLSGTALLALGMFLQSIGWITGGLGYDDEDTLERMAGAQPYALTIGDVSFTIDWMAPSSLPLLIGAEIQKANEEGENLNFFDKLTTVGEPLTELSFLQGVNDIIEGVAYSGEDGLGTFGEVAANLTSSYISQYFPTLGGQVARTLDDTQRTNFVDKNSGLPKTIQKSAQKIMGKIPFAASEKVPYIDAWGKVAKNDNALLRAFENFVSPGYISTIKDDKVNKELAEIYVDTGESGVIPKRAKNSFKVGSETVNLSADDYVQYATNKGQYSRRYLEDVMSNPLYKDLPSDGKAEAIKFLFEFANAKAKSEVSDYDYKESSRYKTAAKLEDAGISASSYAIAKFAMSEANADTDGSGSVSQKEKKKALKNAGFDYSDIRTIININKK